MKKFLHNLLKKSGRQLVEYPNSSLKRQGLIMKNQGINTLFDVGANTGQYGALMREQGYEGRIISFEPMSKAYKILEENASKDAHWQTKNYALGNENGKSTINISENSYSSSILNMLPSHEESAPASKYIASEAIEVRKIDDIFDELCDTSSKVMVKVDTQGFEKNVLDGAVNCIDKISIIELELSLVPLYENSLLYREMIDFVEGKGFELHLLEHVFSNPTTGQLLQLDGVFVRK